MDWFSNEYNIWAVALYPLAAFFLIVLGRALFKDNLFARKETARDLVLLATGLGFAHTCFALGWLFDQRENLHHALISQNWQWLTAGDFVLSVGWLLDPMSIMMLFVVTFISFWIQFYTHGYMEHDEGYARFYAYLALFNFSMLGLVLSTNLFQIYIFWELVGVSSFLLIGFWFTRPSAAAASIKAFLMNRVGDFGFLVGILAFLFFSYSFWQASDLPLLSFTAMEPAARQVLAQAGPGLFALIVFLIFMGPMAKSAQVPLHTWLPDAMEGPTPISALIHAATMVAAGVYLIGRIFPLVDVSGTAQIVIMIVGTLTAVIGATIALTQTDIKKALAYSTMSQLGYMVAAMGVGAFTAALFHLFTHAFFKALLFLCSGSVIHACEDEQDMRKMGGLMNKLPVTGWTYLIGTIAISGVPLTSGFFSKDMILAGAHEFNEIVYWALVVTAGLTAFYMFRTFFLTFWGEYRGEAHVHHENKWMTIPLAVLAVPALGIGAFLSGAFELGPWVFGNFIDFNHSFHAHSFMAMVEEGLIPIGVSLAGIALAFFFYATSQGKALPEKIRTAFAPLYELFAHKWYFDEFYGWLVNRGYLAFARGSASFDRGGIDGIVNGTANAVSGTGYAVKQMQSGKLQVYVAVLFFGIVALSLIMYYGLL